MIGLGWGQWRTRSVSLTKVSHSPDHDPHTYHTTPAPAPARHLSSSQTTDAHFLWQISTISIYLLTISSSSYLFPVPFSCPFHYLYYAFSNIPHSSSPLSSSFFFFAHLRVYPYHSLTHSPSPTPCLTLSFSSHNSNICLLAFSSYPSSYLISLLFVLAATHIVFRGFHGDLPLREIKIQPWRLLVKTETAKICLLYEWK